MTYADTDASTASMAATLGSTLQQMSMSFGLAIGALVTHAYLGGLLQSDQAAIGGALHLAFITLATSTMASSLIFRILRPEDGDSISRSTSR